MEKKLRYWLFGFGLLIVAAAASSASYTVKQPELYCTNGVENTSNCEDYHVLNVNNSLVCTTQNGLCGAGNVSGGYWNLSGNYLHPLDLSHQILAGDGGRGVPSIGFYNNPDTGWYLNNGDEIMLQIDSVEYQTLLSDGRFGLGTKSPGASLQVNSISTTYPVAIFKNRAGQAANMTEWQTSAGVVMSYVDTEGLIYENLSRVCTAANGLCGAGFDQELNTYDDVAFNSVNITANSRFQDGILIDTADGAGNYWEGLCFGDGDTCIMETSDDSVYFYNRGAYKIRFSKDTFNAISGNGYYMRHGTTSVTAPQYSSRLETKIGMYINWNPERGELVDNGVTAVLWNETEAWTGVPFRPYECQGNEPLGSICYNSTADAHYGMKTTGLVAIN